MSGTSLEIKQERELALDEDAESTEDDEILDVGAFLVRMQGMSPALTTLLPFIATPDAPSSIIHQHWTGHNFSNSQHQFCTASAICAGRIRCECFYVLSMMSKSVLSVSFVGPC